MALAVIPATWALPFRVGGAPAAAYGLALPIDPQMMAAGAIVGLRTAASMAGGAVVLFGLLAPWLDATGVFAEMHAAGALDAAEVSPGAIRRWGLWTGSALMVAAGLTAFAFQWRSLVHALAGIRALFGRPAAAAHDPLARIELVPGRCGRGRQRLHRDHEPRLGRARPPRRRGGALGLRAVARGLPRDRRDRHHADRRDG
jgi:hypothetical protein